MHGVILVKDSCICDIESIYNDPSSFMCDPVSFVIICLNWYNLSQVDFAQKFQ